MVCFLDESRRLLLRLQLQGYRKCRLVRIVHARQRTAPASIGRLVFSLTTWTQQGMLSFTLVLRHIHGTAMKD